MGTIISIMEIGYKVKNKVMDNKKANGKEIASSRISNKKYKKEKIMIDMNIKAISRTINLMETVNIFLSRVNTSTVVSSIKDYQKVY